MNNEKWFVAVAGTQQEQDYGAYHTDFVSTKLQAINRARLAIAQGALIAYVMKYGRTVWQTAYCCKVENVSAEYDGLLCGERSSSGVIRFVPDPRNAEIINMDALKNPIV